MKKTIIFLLVFSCLFCMIPPVHGDAISEELLSDRLVVFYDFEGETLKEQLSDKATGGLSAEDLTLHTAENKSYVKDGVLHVANAITEYAVCDFDEKNGAGSDIINCKNTGEMTVYGMVKIGGSLTTGFSDFIDVGNICRIYTRSTDNGVTSEIGARATSQAYTKGTFGQAKLNNSNRTIGSDEWLHLAVSLKYDDSSKTLEMHSYVSQNGGKTYELTSSNFKNTGNALDTFFEVADRIRLSKGAENNGGEFDYEEIRIYNKALSEAELISLQAEGSTMVGFQESEIVNGHIDIRLISGLKELNYDQVGYELTSNGMTNYTSGNTVYRELLAKEENTGKMKAVCAQEFGYSYFYAFSINMIPLPVEGNLTIEVKPYAEKDGVKVYGVPALLTISPDGSVTCTWMK